MREFEAPSGARWRVTFATLGLLAASVGATGCTKQPHTILQIEDPEGVAVGADELSVGDPESTLSERVSLPRDFPLSLVLTSEFARTSAVLVETRRDQVVVGRARVEVEFRTGAARTVIARLVRPCVSQADCDDGVFCNGAEICTAGGLCLPGGAPCRALQFPCVVLTCDELTAQCEVSVDPSLDDGDPCTRDLCDGDGISHPLMLDGEVCAERGATARFVCRTGSCRPAFWGPVEWEYSSAGLTELDVHAVAVEPANPSTVYAGTYAGGVYKSIDQGGSWDLATARLGKLDVRALAIDPTYPNIVYAGTDRGVFKSTDRGGYWIPSNSGLTNLRVEALVVAATDTRVLYASANGVFRSLDQGRSWSRTNSTPPLPSATELAIDPTNPDILYAGTWRDGVFKSVDQGASWSRAGSDLSDRFTVFALAIDPTNSDRLYVGADGGGVSSSTNQGDSWDPAHSGLTNLRVIDLALDPTNPSTLYAGTTDGVFRSTNRGGAWSPASSGLTTTFVQALAIDRANPNILYVGTVRGVFRGTVSP